MSRGATARLFVAIDPPADVCERLGTWARAVVAAERAAGSSRAALRLLDSESMHVTLCFLGSRPVAEIDLLADALASCGDGVCELSVGAPLWLPPRRPRTLAVEIHDHDGHLDRLQQRVTAQCSAASGWLPERRRFRAHVSLARVRGGAAAVHAQTGERQDRGGNLDRQLLPATPQLSFTAEALTLYRSWLSTEGASYEALASCELAAGR